MTEVSVVVPCRNEVAYIGVFERIIDYTSQLIDVEFLFVDGLSVDGTASVIKQFMSTYKNVKLINNHAKTTPQALNLGIDSAQGKFLCRMDCHSDYPIDYVNLLYSKFKIYERDYPKMANLGGVVKTLPRQSKVSSNALAEVLSSKFGVGNSTFRTLDKTKAAIIDVDTVPFGFFRMNVLRKIGGFDEDMVKNQDDHLNATLIASGYEIKCDPSIEINYYPRDKISEIFWMFFNYGFYKPLSALKLSKIPTYRQIVPLVFFIYLLTTAILVGFVNFNLRIWLFIPLFCYVVIMCLCSWSVLSYRKFICKLVFFPLIHLSYGLGYFCGLFRWSWLIK